MCIGVNLKLKLSRKKYVINIHSLVGFVRVRI